jgi:hypothetical protein
LSDLLGVPPFVAEEIDDDSDDADEPPETTP